MINYNQFFLRLAVNGSSNFKKAEILARKDDELLKRLFFMALDPFTNYWIRKIPDYRWSEFGSSDTLDLDMALDELELLSDRTYTGNAAIAHLKNILERMEEHDDCYVIEKIIAGDFKCGVGTTIVNKTWPGLIFEFPCMLANQFDKKLADKFTFPARADLKVDGMRFCAIVKSGVVTFHSRSGKQFDFLGNLESEFLVAADGQDVVYDGEIWIDDGTGKPLPRKISNGICSKALKNTISQKEADAVRVTLWDRIPYDSWQGGYDTTPLKIRSTYLESEIEPFDKLHMIEYHEVNNLDEAQEVFKRYLAQKEEGIILKQYNSPWEDKRSKNQLKYKAERDADLLCIGWEYGNGKNADKVGNLILTTSDGLIECSCGSGMTDTDRERPGDWYIGKIITIIYNERIKSSGDKKESLFLPIFLEVREDKTIANSSAELS